MKTSILFLSRIAMKRTIKLFFAISFIFFSGCKDEPTIEIISEDDFGKIVKLQKERKPTKELLNVRDFFVQDSFLVIHNSREDSLFMVFDLNTFELVKSWGRTGRGPDEYETFTHLIYVSPEQFQVADFSRYRIDVFDIPEFELKAQQKIVFSDTDPERHREIPQSIITPDGISYFYDNFQMHELQITKWENEGPPIDIYKFEPLKELYESSRAYFGNLILNRNEEKLVYAYRYLRRFDILNMEGELLKTVEITPTHSPVEDGVNLDLENSVVSYIGARASENSFFLIYVGQTGAEIQKNEITATYIEEFDWDGNPVARYELNRVIWNMDVVQNEDGSVYFIGIDQADEDPLIIFKE